MVVAMVAMFYLFPALFGTLGRLYTPELLMTGQTDATLLTADRVPPRDRVGDDPHTPSRGPPFVAPDRPLTSRLLNA
jgi:hypothetical protein